MQVALSALVILCSHALLAANHFWSTNWSDNANTGCGFVDKSITLANSAGCFSMNSSVRLQYSSYTPSTNWGTIYQVNSGGHGSTINFSAHMLQTGYYRVIVSGGESPAGACGGHSYRADTSHVLSVTVYSVNANVFNINGNTNVSPTSIQTYGCNAINLNYVPTASTTITNYRLTVQAANASGTPTSGGYNSNPSATWAGSAIPSTINLNTGANATAFSAGGYFLVTLQTQSTTCTSVARKALIFVTPTVATPFANFKINNMTPNNCGSPLETFNCSSAPITLTNLSTGAVSYKVDLFTAPVSCPNGTYSHVHSTGVVTTFPTDAKNLPGGANGTWLQTHTGFFAIIVTAYNACGVSVGSQSLYFNVAGPPPITTSLRTTAATKPGLGYVGPGCTIPTPTNTTTSVGFEYTDGPTSCSSSGGYKYAMQHTNPDQPNEVGRAFTAFDLTGLSGGTGSANAQVTIRVDKKNGSTWDNLNYNGDPENYTGVETAPLTGLLTSNEDNPYFAHFSSAPNGGTYKITITVSNVCSSSSVIQYIKLNTGVLRTVIAASIDDETAEPSNPEVVSVFPNPSESEVSFQVATNEKDVVSITLYDLKGNLVKKLVNQEIASEGISLFSTNIDDLTSGMYLYRVQLNNTVYNGKLSKH